MARKMYQSCSLASLLAISVLHLVNSTSTEEHDNGSKFLKMLKTCRNVTTKAEIEECITTEINKINDAFEFGEPEINLVSLEPVTLETIRIREGTDNLHIQAVFENLKFFGLSELTFRKFDIDYAARAFSFQLIFPNVRMSGVYNLNGNMLSIPVYGNGTFWITGKNVLLDTRFGIYISDGHLKFNVTYLDFDLNKVSIRFNNLFNGDSILGETMNTFMNENSAELVDEIRPHFSQKVKEVLFKVIQDMFDVIPVEDVPAVDKLQSSLRSE